MADEQEVESVGQEPAEAIEITKETSSEGKSSEEKDKAELEEGEDTDSEESGEDDEHESETGEEQEPVKHVSRAQARIRKQQEELKSERADKERLIHERAVAQAQLENLRNQQRELQSASERRAEEERLSLLDPQERQLYQSNQQIRNLEWRLNQMEVQRKDDQDRANFHAKAAHDETYAKYVDKVEEMYQDGIKRGVHASREDLHSYILGRELKKDLSAKISKKKESASKRIDSVTSKPATARGDVSDSKKGKSVEDRLRGVSI